MFSDINSKNGRLIRTGKTMPYSLTCFYNTHRGKTVFTQFSTRMAAWLLLTFFMYLHNHFSSIIPLSHIRE